VAKAWEVHGLRPNARFPDAAGRVILTRWREMMSYRDGTLAGDDIEELHAMRVSSRRLRAAMDAFAGAFPDASFRRYLREVKTVTDTLGEARDLDVAIEALEAIRGDLDAVAHPGIDGLIDRYRDERATESGHIAELFTRLERERFARRFERWVAKHTGIDAAGLSPRPPAAE
jgi:CHAD domain-containing protein